MPITRKDATVIARDDKGTIMRSVECRSVQGAVALETKLASDQAFAEQWARDGAPKVPKVKRHGLERPVRD